MSEKETRIVMAHQVFLEMERRDEEQILDALRGKVIEEFVYEVGGKLGISYAGINEICYEMKHIHVEPWVMWDEDEKYYYAMVRAINTVEDISALGLGQQPKLMKVYDRDPRGKRLETSHLEEDRFAKTKALSKAQRNAKKAVIPLTTIKVFIEEFRKGKTKLPPKPVESRVVRPAGRLLSIYDVQEDLKRASIDISPKGCNLAFDTVSDDILVVSMNEALPEKLVKSIDSVLQGYGAKYHEEQGSWEVPRR